MKLTMILISHSSHQRSFHSFLKILIFVEAQMSEEIPIDLNNLDTLSLHLHTCGQKGAKLKI